MQTNFSEYQWNYIKGDLKTLYPILTDSDLQWRDGTNKADLIKDLAIRVGMSWKALEKIVDSL